MAGPSIFDVTVDNFQTDVLERSRQIPILLDFWAEWCGPCKTLAPLLEKLANEYGGAFLLGKVDSDKEQDLAYAFQVSSIPFVVLLSQGRPVDAFTGMVQERELRAFLAKHKVVPKTAAPEAVEKLDPDSPEALVARAKAALSKGDAEAAREALARIPADSAVDDVKERLLAGLGWFDAAHSSSPRPAAKALVAARQALLASRVEDAMEALLESVALERSYADGVARKAMLICLELYRGDEDQAESFRRRLATALY